jgi:hypothetical protein
MFASAFAYLVTTLLGYNLARQINSFYNQTYIVENVLPYVLMMAISRDVRARWWRKYTQIWRGLSNNSVIPITTA